jgi:hypothetical protein
MRLFTTALAACLVAAGVSAAAAQTQTPAGVAGQPPAGPSALLSFPRVELGAGLGLGVGLASDESGGASLFLPGARVSTALNPRWALEGVFDVMSDDSSLAVIYRVQARWRFRGAADAGRLQPHITFGGTGVFEHETWGPYEWRDQTGTVHAVPRQSRWNVLPPMLPTVGIGFQKTLGSRVALRADLAAIIVPADDFVGVLLMPSVSLSIPIGRYATRRTR